MLKSEQRLDAPMHEQVSFWNAWNAACREHEIDRVSIDQGDQVARWLQQLGRKNLDILEVGCGAGWLCSRLREFGAVTGTDLSNEVLERASARSPDVTYVAGDFMVLDFRKEAYDVIVSLEVLSHVTDQSAFITQVGQPVAARWIPDARDAEPAATGTQRHSSAGAGSDQTMGGQARAN
jgi:2-polyprenyl-3-methyl-5-hydroxy-6-metoxy-1,4-benzoquinol methylase